MLRRRVHRSARLRARPTPTIVDRPTDPTQQPATPCSPSSAPTTRRRCSTSASSAGSTAPTRWPGWSATTRRSTSALSPGTHTFEVRAVDLNEHVDPTPATYTWTYVALPAGVAPDTFIDLAPPLASPVLEAIFTFSSNEPDVTFECSLDGAPFDDVRVRLRGRVRGDPGRPAHLPGARDRLRGQHRPDAGHVHLDHHRHADHRHRRPGLHAR